MILESLQIDINVEDIFCKIEIPKDKKIVIFHILVLTQQKFQEIYLVNGYLNFFVNDLDILKTVLTNIYTQKNHLYSLSYIYVSVNNLANEDEKVMDIEEKTLEYQKTYDF